MGRGDQHEGRLLRAEHLLDLDRALLEDVVHRRERAEEVGELLQQGETGQPRQGPHEVAAGQVEHLQAEVARLERRGEQRAHPLVADEVEHAVRRVEKVERVGGRRRIEHEQVVVAVQAQVDQLLHRDVLLAAGQRRGELLVETAPEDRLAPVGRSALDDQVVPGALEVEHHREELALRLEAGGAQHVGRDPGLGVAQFAQPERGGQPARRIDGEHQRLAPQLRALERQRRGDGRLPDSPGPHTDDHALARHHLPEDAVGHAASNASATRSSAARPNCSENRNGTASCGSLTSSARRSA